MVPCVMEVVVQYPASDMGLDSLQLDSGVVSFAWKTTTAYLYLPYFFRQPSRQSIMRDHMH